MIFDRQYIRIRHGMLQLAAFSLLLSFFVAGCSSKSSDADADFAGGITDIGNAIATVQVAGVVLNQNGSVAVSARVVAYYDSWDQVSASDSVVVFSDSNGQFVLDVDSSANLILFAEHDGACGLIVPERRDNLSMVLGPRKSLEGSVSGAKSGYVRVVGTDEVAKVSEDGSFVFENVPPGDVSLAYFQGDKPQGHMDFKTMDDRDQISLPPMENPREDGLYYSPDYNDGMFGVDFGQRDDHHDMAYTNIALHMDDRVPVFDANGNMTEELSFVEGMTGRAVDLAPGQYIDLGEVGFLAGDFTLSLWTRWVGAGDATQILFRQGGIFPGEISFQWYFDGDSGRFAVMMGEENPDAVYFGDSASILADSWSFLVLVYHEGSVSMYVNGIELGSASVNYKVSSSLAHLHVGGSLGMSESSWIGPVDEVHVDGVAQSVDWILFIYEHSLSPKNPAPRK